MDLQHFVFYLLGLFAVIWLLQRGMVVRAVAGLRLEPMRFRHAHAEEAPSYLDEMFSPVVAQLKSLGFTPGFWMRYNEIHCHSRSEHFALVCIHPSLNAYAQIAETTQLRKLPGCDVSFHTLFSDGEELATLSGGQDVALFVPLRHTTSVDSSASGLEEQWSAHQNALERETNSRRIAPASAEVYIARQQQVGDWYFEDLRALGWIEPTGETYRLRLGKLIAATRQILRAQRALQRLQAASKASRPHGDEGRAPLGAHVAAFRWLEAVQKKPPLSRRAKLLLFIATGAASLLAFGIAFDFRAAAILVGVLLFHELGHLAAMYAFGYRDLHVLFVPLFGAAAVGTDEDVSTAKRIIVSLAGPMPGIVAGLALAAYPATADSPVFVQIALFLLVINYLNLLPLMPLDGGQIVRLALAEPFPLGKLILYAVSCVSFLVGSYFLGEPILLVLAVLMGWGCLAQFREAALVRRLRSRDGFDPRADDEQLLTSIFSAVMERDPAPRPFLQIYSLVRAIREHFVSSPTLSSVAFSLLAVYLVAFLGTPVAGAYFALDSEQRGRLVSLFRTEEVPDFDERLASEPAADARALIHWDAARYYADRYDFELAVTHYAGAIAELSTRPEVDPRRVELLSALADVLVEPVPVRGVLDAALDENIALYGPDHGSNASLLVKMAWTYDVAESDSRAAIPLLERAVQLQERQGEPQPDNLAETLVTLAYFQEELVSAQDALVTLFRAYALYESAADATGDHAFNGAEDGLFRLLVQQGEHQAAWVLLDASLSSVQSHAADGNGLRRAALLRKRGWLAAIEDDPAAAARELTTAVAVIDRASRGDAGVGGFGYIRAEYLLDTAYMAGLAGDEAMAERYLQRLRDDLAADEDPTGEYLRQRISWDAEAGALGWIGAHNAARLELLNAAIPQSETIFTDVSPERCSRG